MKTLKRTWADISLDNLESGRICRPVRAFSA